MVFDNDKHNSDDDPLLISFSVKKGKSIKNDKRIKKTKRQLIEEKMLEVDDNEIRSIVRQLEDKIDREIALEIEIEESNKQNEDEIRADIILKEDELIKSAFDNCLVTKKEIVMFIDYYELLSKINNKKLNVCQILEKIKEECPIVKDKDYWEKLKIKIENSLQMKDAVIDYPSNNDITDNKIENTTIRSLTREEFEKKNREQVIVTQKFGINKLISFKNKHIEENSLRSSSSSLKNVSKVMKIPKNFDLHEDIKLNHLHVNQNAKKLVISKDFKSKNASLFSFKPKIAVNDEDLKNRFIEMLELPNKVIEEYKLNDGKKSHVKSKILDALNYVKGKTIQLKKNK